MAFFRKKPVVIEAVEYAHGKVPIESLPGWYIDAMMSHRIYADENSDDLIIKTLEGEMHASRGDWIIRGVKGEVYPCKPDIFEATYDPA
jgi:hypothetical protein